MTDEVEIVDDDPRWPQRFALESARVRQILTEPLLEIEHHGSTAVPAAKPVIDMLVAVDSMARAARYAAVLIEFGYEAVDARYRELWPERIVLIRRERGVRVCHVHRSLAGVHDGDRHAYMTAKGEFIERVTAMAIREP